MKNSLDRLDIREFLFQRDELKSVADDILRHSTSLGASAASTEVSERDGQSVTVRNGCVETIQLTHDTNVAVTVYFGKKRGHASTGDFSPRAIRQAVEAACDIARFTTDDEAGGLADGDQLERAPRDLDLFHPESPSLAQSEAWAKRAEAASFNAHRSVTHSQGASVRSSLSQFILATTEGFASGYATSLHSISCTSVATGAEQKQRESWASSTVRAEDLDSPESIGARAGIRASSRLNARRIATCKVPVLFESTQALSLLATFVGAVSGAAVYKGTSFLADALGKQVFSKHIRMIEAPHALRGLGSAPFDAEGVQTSHRVIVEDGVLQGHFLSAYSARKLGLRSTGNAGGVHNLSLNSDQTTQADDFEGMLQRLGTGLLVTDMMGQGANIVTGGYSRGAAGFWVEKGAIQFPVHELTVASTLQHMFGRIVAIGSDRYTSGTLSCGSILVEDMTVAGK